MITKKDCQKYKDGYSLCQEQCYFTTSGLKNCVNKKVQRHRSNKYDKYPWLDINKHK